MAISEERYIRITSGSVGASAIQERDLNGLLFTQGKGWIGADTMDSGAVLKCYSMDQVMKYFSSESPEAAFANRYFSYTSPSGTSPASLSFARVRVYDQSGKDLYWLVDGGIGGWYVAGDKATFSLTVTKSGVAVGDTLSIGDTTYTFKNFRNGVNQFVISDTEAEIAAGIAETINGTSGVVGQTANEYFVAVADGSKVEFTAKIRGTYGNSIEVKSTSVGIDFEGLTSGYPTNGTVDVAAQGSVVIESPSDALSRVNSGINNFGSFAFIDPPTDSTSTWNTSAFKSVASQNAGYNYRYLCSLGVIFDDELLATTNMAAKLTGINGCALTSGADLYSAADAMAMFGATDYNSTNTATTYMFKQIPGETPTVTSDDVADRLDQMRVNYYGLTQTNGTRFPFFQRGVNMDGQDTAVYCNEVWLKSKIATAIFNLLVSVERVPANADGESLITSTVVAVIQHALSNGVIEIGRTLNQAQRAAVYTLTGDPGAYINIENSGYWITVDIVDEKAIYKLVYAKGDAIRKVEGSNILV